ncbi:hypothetical protein WOLCODRAFT_146992 [Wolfiporia cocos MD-104 SS10]|uniref:F-box domain-containing protein n=1 Tax=Wolfiporia cocos (strain MD-104) TaxID=742152 RepID=A0A2H3JDI3_WOLCO|nr:hypothetical protein WOLCODRAFT_146992 [Wolfiporia cocos MD-104 SS10]
MPLLSLNHDVLYEVLAQTDYQSAMRLSMVSRDTHELGIRHALTRVTLSRSQKQVSAFCKFVLADPANRLPNLRELTIESGAFGVARHIEFQRKGDFSAAADLADLLEHADQLRRLSLACFEDLIVTEPRIGAALCALPNLVDLGLHQCGQSSMSIFPLLRSQPRKIAFTSLFNRRLPTFFHRLQGLKQLETLELSHLDLSDGSQPHAEIHEIPSLPTIRSLSLRGCTARMSLFVHAMPHLRSLSIADVFTKVEDHADYTKRGCWAGLTCLRGNVSDFRYWKVRCPVRWLQLDLTAYHYHDALDVIQRTSPVALSLPVETRADAPFWTGVRTAAPRLRYLEVCLDEVKGRSVEWWLRDWLTGEQQNICPAMAILPIVAICLCVRKTQWIGADTDQGIPDPRTDAAFRALREGVKGALPSLHFIALALATKGENPFERRHRAAPVWWRVHSSSSGRTLDFIPDDKSGSLRDHLIFKDSIPKMQ